MKLTEEQIQQIKQQLHNTLGEIWVMEYWRDPLEKGDILFTEYYDNKQEAMAVYNNQNQYEDTDVVITGPLKFEVSLILTSDAIYD